MVRRGNGGEDVEGAVVQERRCNDDELGREAMQDHEGDCCVLIRPSASSPSPIEVLRVKEIGCLVVAHPVTRPVRAQPSLHIASLP